MSPAVALALPTGMSPQMPRPPPHHFIATFVELEATDKREVAFEESRLYHKAHAPFPLLLLLDPVRQEIKETL